jgi:hypothetical protein
MNSHYKPIRFPDDLYQQIETHRTNNHSKNFSIWIKEAAIMRLEQDQGLTNHYAKELSDLNKEILALGRNLNQIARAANSGLPVNADRALLSSLGKMLRSTQQNLLEVRSKLL